MTTFKDMSPKPLFRKIREKFHDFRTFRTEPLDVMLRELEVLGGTIRAMKLLEISHLESVRNENGNLLRHRREIINYERDFERLSAQVMKCPVFRFVAGRLVEDVSWKLREVRAETERVQGMLEMRRVMLLPRRKTPDELLLEEDDDHYV